MDETCARATDLRVEDGEGPGRVQRDENPDQELLMLRFQRQREAVDDAAEDKGFEVNVTSSAPAA